MRAIAGTRRPRRQSTDVARRAKLRVAVFDGRRGRPVVMLSATTALAPLPMVWSTGTGAGVMKRIAAPMVGGVVTTAVEVLLVFSAFYCIWRGWRLSRRSEFLTQANAEPAPPRP